MESVFEWYIKERVIFHRPFGELSLDAVQQNNGYIVKMLDEGKPLVHIIVDARFVTKVPTNLLKMSIATNFLSHPSLGWVVTISTNATVNFLAGILPQIGNLRRYRVFAELDQGIIFLKEQDSMLDWVSANNQVIEA